MPADDDRISRILRDHDIETQGAGVALNKALKGWAPAPPTSI